MNVYAESSAVLAWLLGEPKGESAYDLLESADNVYCSDLLFVECERALIRVEAAGALTTAAARDRRAALNREARFWMVSRIGGEILDRARQPFPREPVRSLDAIHLATLIVGASIFLDIELLSFDERIRENAAALGFAIAAA